MRDRLIELILSAETYDEYECEFCAKPDCLRCYNEKFADHLLANGVILLPCKVGDTVWFFSHRPFNLEVQAKTIYPATVIRITTRRNRMDMVLELHNPYGTTEVAEISSFGKTVFLSREEAEKALKGGEE